MSMIVGGDLEKRMHMDLNGSRKDSISAILIKLGVHYGGRR